MPRSPPPFRPDEAKVVILGNRRQAVGSAVNPLKKLANFPKEPVGEDPFERIYDISHF